MKNNLKMKNKKNETKNSGIIEYWVCINVNEFDKIGNIKNTGIVKKFNSEDMLANRREAISYYSDQRDFFLGEKEFDFSSPYEQKLKLQRFQQFWDLA